jgi:hypothetical protein
VTAWYDWVSDSKKAVALPLSVGVWGTCETPVRLWGIACQAYRHVISRGTNSLGSSSCDSFLTPQNCSAAVGIRHRSSARRSDESVLHDWMSTTAYTPANSWRHASQPATTLLRAAPRVVASVESCFVACRLYSTPRTTLNSRPPPAIIPVELVRDSLAPILRSRASRCALRCCRLVCHVTELSTTTLNIRRPSTE